MKILYKAIVMQTIIDEIIKYDLGTHSSAVRNEMGPAVAP